MQKVVRDNPSCTFEASEVWRKILRLFPLKERCVEGDGFCLYYWTHPFYQGAVSTPFRDRMALTWGDNVPSGTDIATLVTCSVGPNFIIKDLGVMVDTLSMGQSGLVHDYVNSEVTLDGEIEKRFKPSARKNLRKAQQEYGLTIEIDAEGVFENFYGMYLNNRRRLGVLPYPRLFFRSLFDFRGSSVVVFVCRSSKEILGFLICYLHGHEMISGHLAYDFNQRHKRISDFLFMSAFHWGYVNGFNQYRFGADNRNQQSLIESKRKLGAIERMQWDFCLPYRSRHDDNPESFVRQLLRVTPMPLFKHAGLLTKLYFG